VLATGPLTNVAQWLERYPDDREAVDRLVIMGGTIDAPGNIIVPGFTDDHPNTRRSGTCTSTPWRPIACSAPICPSNWSVST
jgi:hypothetical protein